MGLGFDSLDGGDRPGSVGTIVVPPSLFWTGVGGSVPGVMPGITMMGPGPGGGDGESVGCGPTVGLGDGIGLGLGGSGLGEGGSGLGDGGSGEGVSVGKGSMLGEGISVGNGETVGEGISWVAAGLGTARIISINVNETAARRQCTTRYYPSSVVDNPT